MFTEMESPWAGDGRGVVTQRIFSKDGTLLATCFQEVSFFIFFFLSLSTLCCSRLKRLAWFMRRGECFVRNATLTPPFCRASCG